YTCEILGSLRSRVSRVVCRGGGFDSTCDARHHSLLGFITRAKVPILAGLVEAPALDFPRLGSQLLPWLRDARYSAGQRFVAQAGSRSQGHRAPYANGA